MFPVQGVYGYNSDYGGVVMKKHKLESTRIILILSLLALVHLSLSGCTGIKAVSAENRLLFAENSPQGIFSFGDLTVNYRYHADGPQLAVSGKIDYRRSFDSLDVYAMLFDANGTVIQKKLIYASGFRTSADRVNDISFQESLVLPPRAVGISFDSFAQDRRSYQ